MRKIKLKLHSHEHVKRNKLARENTQRLAVLYACVNAALGVTDGLSMVIGKFL